MTWLERACRTALECTPQVYVLTPWPERYQIPNPCQFLLEAPRRGEGPLVAFVQALPHLPPGWILLLACDLPRLDPGLLRRWWETVQGIPPPLVALACRLGGWEPLCGFYADRCRASLDEFVAGGGRSFQAWLAVQPVFRLPLDDTDLLLNCNTPADLDQINYKGAENSLAPVQIIW